MKENNTTNSINIKDIKDPHFLRELNYHQLEELSTKIKKEIIDATSKNGGHLSSNLGVTELTMSLHRNFDFMKDKLLFDVGHQCYTHKILTGRDISKIRTKDGVSGFIKFNESPYDIFESGHSSTSLSAALAFAMDRDNKKENYDVVALIGDASIANGVAFEALNNIPHSKHKVIIVLNDNEMAISQPVGGMSNFFRLFQTSRGYAKFKKGFMKALSFVKPLYNLASRFKNFVKRHLIATNLFDSLGFIYIGVVDGHDFKALDKAFKKAKKTNASVIIHVRTKKGYGYPLAENDKTGTWHGVEPFNIETGEPLNPHLNEISWSKLYSEFVKERLASDEKFYLICPGTLVGSCLSDLIKMYPMRVIDTGISEEHAIVLAANLAKLGYHVCVSIYSTFMQRGFDQIAHDVARVHAPVVFLVDRSGLVGSDGETHQGTFDSSFLFATPNTNVYMASNKNEAYQIFDKAFKNNEPTFIRYPRAYIDKNPIDKKYQLKEFNLIKSGDKKVALVSVGPLTSKLLEFLISTDITIINPILLKPMAKSLVNELLNYQNIVIYTPYETSNGFAANLIQELINNHFKGAIYTKAIPLKFFSHASIDEQLNDCELLPAQVAKFAQDISHRSH
ncbi:MAG: 1-deoxy-D-xylulose-5-phosphate synthase [Bacilli bacterium]|nr:1-deoxy-D-xylulose-5-phosphate synthase [Bacilli bacterium]